MGPWGRFAVRLAVIVALLAVWQLVVSVGLVDEFYLSKPTVVFADLARLLAEPAVHQHLLVTSRELLVGLVVGAVAGVAAGLVMGAIPALYEATSPVIATLYTLPRLALLPLFVLWFGIGEGSKVALVVSLVFFSMLLNTYSGMRGVDRSLVDAVRLMGGGRWAVLREVTLPAIAPWLVAGLRISLVFAVTGSVVGEMMVSKEGLGFLLIQKSGTFDTAGVLAILVIVAVVANVLDVLFSAVEKRARRWSRDGTGGAAPAPRRLRSRSGGTRTMQGTAA
jgi:NitT/TauT family transport system permease protein